MFYNHAVTAPAPEDGVELSAFTAERVRRLTNLTARQIQYWDEQHFISPSLTRRKGRGRRRLYSFRDLVALKVAAELRKSFSLQLIRRVNDYLRNLDYRSPLEELYFQESAQWQEARQTGQVVASFMVPVGEIAEDLRRQISADRAEARKPGVIETRRGVLGSRPVFAGTRIAVETVLNLLRDGASEHEVENLYPDLTPADIEAARTADKTRRRRRAS
jgi:uncharacterized protein (DUF433 family)/DNA-binding transcriptional MerR regulator